MWDFVMENSGAGQVFSKYFGFPCQSSLHQFLHNHHRLSSGAGTIDQYWPQYQETQSHTTNKNNNNNNNGGFDLHSTFFIIIIWFVKLLALRPLLAYCAGLG
jgi:hypothetical protein